MFIAGVRCCLVVSQIIGVDVRDIGRKSKVDAYVSCIDILDSAESSKTSGGETTTRLFFGDNDDDVVDLDDEVFGGMFIAAVRS